MHKSNRRWIKCRPLKIFRVTGKKPLKKHRPKQAYSLNNPKNKLKNWSRGSNPSVKSKGSIRTNKNICKNICFNCKGKNDNFLDNTYLR